MGSMGTTLVHCGTCLGSSGEANTPRTQEIGTMVPSLCVWRAGVWKQEIKAIGLSGPLPLKKPCASLSFIIYFATAYLGTLLGHLRARLDNRRTFLVHCGDMPWFILDPSRPQEGSRWIPDSSWWPQDGSRLAQDRLRSDSREFQDDFKQVVKH